MNAEPARYTLIDVPLQAFDVARLVALLVTSGEHADLRLATYLRHYAESEDRDG